MTIESQLSKQMMEKYNEKQEFLNNFKELDIEYFHDKTFIMFTYETLRLGKLDSILNTIENNGFKIEYYSVRPNLSEKTLIDFYKYHQPNKSCELEPYGSMIPSIGWSTVRKRFNNIVIGAIVSRNNDAIQEMIKLKGNAYPKLCSSNQIRKNAPNIVLSMMHSADDIFSVVRESTLFFSWTELNRIINNVKRFSIDYVSMLRLKSQLYDTKKSNFYYVVNKIVYNLLEKSTLENPNTYNINIKYMEYIIDNLYTFNEETYKTISKNIFNNKNTIIETLVDKKIPNLKDIDVIIESLENNALCEKGWESLLIESHLTEAYWEGYK
ncbi:hypothetical protein GH131_10475 [Staphylococcus pseudintermedius]|nr:hypothetical protein [Staphylococcus pseudintermedius]